MATGRRPLFLVGYRGSGKTTVAQIMAERLAWNWLDLDAVLEQRARRSIRQIFAEDGEAGFRDLEAGHLAELCYQQNVVIATGGGIVLRPDNRQLLRDSGRVVWLTGDPAILWQRLQADATTRERRPDLTVGGLAEVEQLLRVREPLYAECAHHQVDTAGLTAAQVADAILDKWASDAISTGETRATK